MNNIIFGISGVLLYIIGIFCIFNNHPFYALLPFTIAWYCFDHIDTTKKNETKETVYLSKKEKEDKERKEYYVRELKSSFPAAFIWGVICANGSFFLGAHKEGIVFSGIVGFIFGYVFTFISTLFKSAKKKSEDEEHEFKQSIITLIGVMVKVDGNIMSCETEKAKSAIRRYFKDFEEQNIALGRLQSIINSKHDYNIAEICDNVEKKFSYTAKSELIMELLAIAYADDSFNESEELVIKDVAERLNISQQEYRSIYTIFIKKYKQGSYNGSHPQRYNDADNGHADSDYEPGNSNNKYSRKDSHSNSSHNNHKSNEISEDEAYDILGAEKNVSDAEIKKVYRTMAVKYHPDNAVSLGEEAVRQATETMKQINSAWEVVKERRGIK